MYVVKRQKPETTQQLIQIVQNETNLSSKEITDALYDLEADNLLNFGKKPVQPSVKQSSYFLSEKTVWYWIIIGFAILSVVSVFVIPEGFYPVAFIRVGLGAVFVLLFPGYAFVRVLFPRKFSGGPNGEIMNSLERVVIGVGMSFVFVVLSCLVLNYTPWSITYASVSLSLLTLTVAFATAALLRERKLESASFDGGSANLG